MVRRKGAVRRGISTCRRSFISGGWSLLMMALASLVGNLLSLGVPSSSSIFSNSHSVVHCAIWVAPVFE